MPVLAGVGQGLVQGLAAGRGQQDLLAVAPVHAMPGCRRGWSLAIKAGKSIQ